MARGDGNEYRPPRSQSLALTVSRRSPRFRMTSVFCHNHHLLIGHSFCLYLLNSPHISVCTHASCVFLSLLNICTHSYLRPVCLIYVRHVCADYAVIREVRFIPRPADSIFSTPIEDTNRRSRVIVIQNCIT